MAKSSSVPIGVESICVPLEVDGSLLLSSVQSAFPGAHSLYYYDTKEGSSRYRTTVKYDISTRKLYPPITHNIDYYVSLGNCGGHQTGPYAEASRQFERSVSAVRQMLAGLGPTTGTTNGKKLREAKKKVAFVEQGIENEVSSETVHTDSSSSNMSLLNTTHTEQKCQLSTMDEQIFDLARLISAKDGIIEQQRIQLQSFGQNVTDMDCKSQSLEKELAQLREHSKAQSDELLLLRDLAQEQRYMCNKVETLEGNYKDLQREKSEQKDIFVLKSTENESEIARLKAKIEQMDGEIKSKAKHIGELEDEVKTGIGQLQVTSQRLTELEPLAELIGVGQSGVVDYMEMRKRCSQMDSERVSLEQTATDNAAKVGQLTCLADSLGSQFNLLNIRTEEALAEKERLAEKLKKIDDEWREKMAEERGEWTRDRDYLAADLKQAQERVSQLTFLTDTFAVQIKNSDSLVADIL